MTGPQEDVDEAEAQLAEVTAAAPVGAPLLLATQLQRLALVDCGLTRLPPQLRCAGAVRPAAPFLRPRGGGNPGG